MREVLLHILARYAIFLRYCAVGVAASAVFYLVANTTAMYVDRAGFGVGFGAANESTTNTPTTNTTAPNIPNPNTQRDLHIPQAPSASSKLAVEQAQAEKLDSSPQCTSVESSTCYTPHTLLASLCGSLASFVFGYFAQMRLAFRAHPNHSLMLPRYLILLALIAIYAQAITYLGSGFSYHLTSAFIALSVPVFSYPLQRFWVFATAKNSMGGGRHIT